MFNKLGFILLSLIVSTSSFCETPKSDKSCKNLLKESGVATIKFRAFDQEIKIDLLQKIGPNQSDYVWQEFDKQIDLEAREKKIILEINRYVLSKAQQKPIINSIYREQGVVSIGKPYVVGTVLRDLKTNELLGVDVTILHSGAIMPIQYNGVIHFNTFDAAKQKGANVNADASWNFGGAYIEILGNQYKVLYEDYTQTWTGF